MSANQTAPQGELSYAIIRPVSPTVIIKDSWMHPTLADVFRYDPKSHLGMAIKAILKFVPDTEDARAAILDLIDRATATLVVESSLYGKVSIARRNRLWGKQTWEDLGELGHHVVTTVGAGFIVDAFQGLVEPELMKFHGLGTGSGAEAVGDTALGTELTTEYTSNVRATGTTTEASATVYQTVATNTLDGTPGAALREHGIFSANAAGVLLDRTVFAAVNLVSGDAFQSTYNLTFSPGS